MSNALTSRLKKKKKGFTLIELIIVIAIIAIIAAIAIPNYSKVRSESKTKADVQSADTIKKITETLLIDGKIYPGNSVTFVFSGKDISSATAAKGTGTKDPTATTLTDYYKAVKAPQGDSATNYSVSIDATSGDVTVTATP